MDTPYSAKGSFVQNRMDDADELKSRSAGKTRQLMARGVDIPNPLTLDIGDEVDVNRISGQGVKIYPGCRIYGAATVISAGTRLGSEGPVTIEDCQLGRNVDLKGGYVAKSVFLDKATMGLGAHVREGCILEEETGGAHCVGLKQTILFPFVTLGSLINFCDCLMAGGTSRRNHSEVGSSYIHFNFTPDGDKTTPSLIGDVPRGVVLNQPPIFLGGQGGMIGPARIGYGNVVAAGSILRSDYLAENQLIIGKSEPWRASAFVPASYPGLVRIVKNNIIYLANLAALEEWYLHVRRRFLEREEFGTLIFQGLLDKLDLARKERLTRLRAMAEKVSSNSTGNGAEPGAGERKEFCGNVERLEGLFGQGRDPASERLRDAFLKDLEKMRADSGPGYIESIQALPAAASRKAVAWLEHIVTAVRGSAALALPSFGVSED